MPNVINIIDLDGCVAESIFNNDRLKNDNKNCLTPEFLADLSHIAPFRWAMFYFNHVVVENDIIIAVTGRLPEHEPVTRHWWKTWCRRSLNEFISISWNDKLKTREDSYRDYVKRKSKALVDLVKNYHEIRFTLGASGWRIRLFEDDILVSHRVISTLYQEELLHNTDMVLVRNGQVLRVQPDFTSAIPTSLVLSSTGHETLMVGEDQA